MRTKHQAFKPYFSKALKSASLGSDSGPPPDSLCDLRPLTELLCVWFSHLWVRPKTASISEFNELSQVKSLAQHKWLVSIATVISADLNSISIAGITPGIFKNQMGKKTTKTKTKNLWSKWVKVRTLGYGPRASIFWKKGQRWPWWTISIMDQGFNASFTYSEGLCPRLGALRLYFKWFSCLFIQSAMPCLLPSSLSRSKALLSLLPCLN